MAVSMFFYVSNHNLYAPEKVNGENIHFKEVIIFET